MTRAHSTGNLPVGFSGPRIQAHIAESHRYFEDLEKRWDELVEKHEGQWVVSYKGEFRFGATIHDVIREAKSAGWPLDVIAVDHLTRERAAVLL